MLYEFVPSMYRDTYCFRETHSRMKKKKKIVDTKKQRQIDLVHSRAFPDRQDSTLGLIIYEKLYILYYYYHIKTRIVKNNKF